MTDTREATPRRWIDMGVQENTEISGFHMIGPSGGMHHAYASGMVVNRLLSAVNHFDEAVEVLRMFLRPYEGLDNREIWLRHSEWTMLLVNRARALLSKLEASHDH